MKHLWDIRLKTYWSPKIDFGHEAIKETKFQSFRGQKWKRPSPFMCKLTHSRVDEDYKFNIVAIMKAISFSIDKP